MPDGVYLEKHILILLLCRHILFLYYGRILLFDVSYGILKQTRHQTARRACMKESIMYETQNRHKGNYPYIARNMLDLNAINHFHEELEVLLVTAGQVEAFLEDGIVTIHKDELCIIMPGEIHGYNSQFPNQTIVMKIPLVCEIENFNFLLMRLDRRILKPADQYYDEVLRILYEITEENDRKIPGYEFAVQAAQCRLITLLIRKLSYEFVNSDKKERIKNSALLLQMANEYIEQHYTRQIKLADAAAHCKYSVYYFSHYFKEITGVSFGDYLLLYRLKKSVLLMTATRAKLTEIAFSCGFNNIRSFNRMFKKNFGVTPTEYRKNTAKTTDLDS